MRRYAFLLLLVLALPVMCIAGPFSRAVMSGISSSESCASCSVTLDESDNTGAAGQGLTTWSKGQSFRVSTTDPICSIEIVFNASYSGTMEVRWGTTANLTTYEATKSDSFSSVSSHNFVFDDKVAPSADTDIFFSMIKTAGTVQPDRSSSDTYDCSPGDCKFYYADGADWDMDSSSATDLAFKVYQCD
jgi:hypothetical protein